MKNENQVPNHLSKVSNRKDLLSFAQSKGYDVSNSRIPLDFYKKEINLVDFARALGYEYSEKNEVSQASFQRQKWFYMDKTKNKFPELERSENQNSQILIGRRSENPSSPNFKYNEHYYFSQNLTHTGDRGNHGSVIDLVQLHFKADFKDTIKIIENFAINNEELKEKSLAFHVSGSDVTQASTTKRLEQYHNIKPLHDTKFLNSRGIENETLSHPYFRGNVHNSTSDDGKHTNTAFPILSEKGLIGFEVRNTDFKSVLDNKNDGFWRSNVDHSKKVKELFVCESALDAISKHEIDSLKVSKISKNEDNQGSSDKANSLQEEEKQTVYLSSAGSVTGKQIDLLQTIVDKGLSKKILKLEDIPEREYKNVSVVTHQRDYNGKTMINETTGKPVEIAHLHYNKPEKLSLAFDSDSSGQLYNAKILGKLKVSEFFNAKDENCPLKNSEVVPYVNKKTNWGQLSWNVKNENVGEIDKGVNKIKEHFEKLNGKYENKITEGEPFKLIVNENENSPNEKNVDIKFRNITKAWGLAVDSIKDLKFQGSEKVEIKTPVLDDWNDDLKAIKGIDPVLKRKFDVYESVNNFESNKGKNLQINKGSGDEITDEINKMMDKKPRGIKM